MLSVRDPSYCARLSLIKLSVLRYLCSNPHGLFWAGDTAQTIAIGSSFRFDDLKSSLYSFEVRLGTPIN